MAEFDLTGIVPDPLGDVKDFISSDSGLLTAVGLGALFGGDVSDRPSVGYQGSIPEYTAVRQAVANTFDADRRPGSGGRRYFTDVQYVPETDTVILRRSYPTVKEFLLTILHEIGHALDAKRLGVRKYIKKYTQAGTMATYKGLDPHDDNKWEEKAERFARRELSKWL